MSRTNLDTVLVHPEVVIAQSQNLANLPNEDAGILNINICYLRKLHA
jgi:hypothetical protein